MQIRHKLILGFVGIALLVGVVGYLAVYASQKTLQQSIGESSASLAVKALDLIDRNIYHSIEVFQEHSRDLGLQKTVLESNQKFEQLDNTEAYINEKDKEWTSAPKGEITPFIQELMNSKLSQKLRDKLEFYEEKHGYKVFGEIYVTNKYGVVIALTGRTSDYLQADEQWYQKAVAEKVFWVGDVEYDESSDTYASDIVVNLYDNEENFSGIIKAVLNIKEAINVLREAKASAKYKTTQFKLLTKDGMFIYSTEDFEFFENISHKLLSRLHQESGKHLDYFIAEADKPGEGEELFTHAHSRGYKDFQGLGWTLIIEHETKEIFAPVAKLRNTILVISLAVAMLALVLGLLISTSISRPITKLKDAASEIGKGNLDVQIEIESNDELAKLAASFNEMGRELKEYHVNLETKVKERTSELRGEVGQRTSAQKVLEQRIKEINCLYGLSKLIERPQISFEQILQETTELIRSTYRHPDITCVRTTFSGIHYQTDNFAKSELSQYALINIKAEKVGTIEVYYLGEKQSGDEGPFLEEERDLLDAVAEHLGRIAERAKTGKKLELFRNLIDRSNDCIFVIEPKWGRFLDANDKACTTLGYTQEELLGMTIKDVEESIPDDPSWQEHIKELKLKTDSVIEGRQRRKDGTTFFTETSLKLVSQDKEEHIIAIARDITERKQAEEATALAYRKLEEANRELKEMQGQLVQSEKMASIGQLAAGVAHEMNTPVGFVASNFQTLENYVSKFKSLVEMYDELIGGIEVSEKAQLLDKANAISQSRDDMKIDFVLEDIQGLFDDSKEGLSRVTNIIQNLRDFSRIDQVEEFDEYDINAGIEATLVVARNEIKYHSDVKAKLSKNVPHLYCNASQINQVFLNILLNASQAIKSREKEDKKGTITIRTYVADDHVMCEISDDGRGIDPENLSKIFDPFFTTKSVGSGTGLGLSVSYDIIVNKHKGELFADSTVGKGTTFTIKLPISRKNAGDKQETEKNEKENSIICRR
ncbi:MAG: ATP-binding protein [Planctomycetota bacterium]|jgi:PAS domain S-box-containing protein